MAQMTDIAPNDDAPSDMLTSMSTPPGEMARIGRLVRLERQRLGLSQDDLAERAGGLNRNTVGRIERGATSNPKMLHEVLAALGLNASELIIEGPTSIPAPGAAPPLAHLSDAQLSNEAMRLLAELTSRLAARPVASAIPPRGTYGTISAVEDPPDNGHHSVR